MDLLVPTSRHGGLGALLLLGQLGPNLMGELVQVLVHALHAEPLGVEETAVLTERESPESAPFHTRTGCAQPHLFVCFFSPPIYM